MPQNSFAMEADLEQYAIWNYSIWKEYLSIKGWLRKFSRSVKLYLPETITMKTAYWGLDMVKNHIIWLHITKQPYKNLN